MRIQKILNNNVVVIVEDGVEKVVMGRGIAFQKKVGDLFDRESVDKIFTLTQEVTGKYQELLVNIPIEHIEVVDEIIQYAKEHISQPITDVIYISLIDHISTSITRCQDGITVKNALLWDVKRFYKDEFKIGLKALDIIAEKIGVTLPVDEAGFIALHLINSQLNTDKDNNINEITKIMQDILNIIKYTFKINFDEDSIYFYRFITHLKFFSERLLNQEIIRNMDEDDSLLMRVKEKYHEAYRCTLKIVDFIAKQYRYILSPDEVLYLTIHIERMLMVNREKEGDKVEGS